MSGSGSALFPAARVVSKAMSPKAQGSRRRDIQGLRAFAVLVVILDHLIHWPAGGFIGVDIFFVISGYLISGILIREVQSKGRVDFREFYIRRAKRILPAAAVVLSVTVTAAYVLFYSGQAASIAVDAFWSLVFSANWHFALLGTDYMHIGASVSPLQHFWSLAVEEQFYVVWPWVLMAALGLATKLDLNSNGRRIALLSSIVLVAVISFGFAIYETTSHPTVAYFSTFSRAWELAAGAILATSIGYLGQLSLRTRTVLLYLGLAGLGASLFLIGPETPFPAPYALLPVVSTMFVLMAGEQADAVAYNRTAWVLTNPLSQYLGKISYSLYLWHFPVIILLGVILPSGSKRHLAASALLFFVLSVLSFRFVEDPLRRLKFSKAVPSSTTRRATRHSQGHRNSVVAIALLGCFVVVPPAVAFVIFSPEKALSNTGASKAGTDATVDQRQQSIKAALEADVWPDLHPNAAELGPDGANAKPSEWIKDGCLGGTIVPQRHVDDVIENAKRCVYGDPNSRKSMVIYGDSTTMSFVPGLRAALQGQDWVVYIYTVGGCTPTIVTAIGVDGSTEECKKFKSWVEEDISRKRPTMVVSSYLRNDKQLANNKTGLEADAEWRREVEDTANFMAQYTSKYVMLEAPSSAVAEPSQCISRVSKPSDCITHLSPTYLRQTEVLRSALQSAGKSNALFIGTKDWFCSGGKCPAFIGTTGTYADVNHISAAAASELAPFLQRALELR